MFIDEHFLQIYNSNYEDILAFVENGHIYLLTDENF